MDDEEDREPEEDSQARALQIVADLELDRMWLMRLELEGRRDVGNERRLGRLRALRRLAWRHRCHAPMLGTPADGVEAGGGTRTHGLALTRGLLYQLSYSGKLTHGSE